MSFSDLDGKVVKRLTERISAVTEEASRFLIEGLSDREYMLLVHDPRTGASLQKTVRAGTRGLHLRWEGQLREPLAVRLLQHPDAASGMELSLVYSKDGQELRRVDLRLLPGEVVEIGW